MEDLLSVTNMPASAGVFEQTRSQRSGCKGNEENDEDEICDRWDE